MESWKWKWKWNNLQDLHNTKNSMEFRWSRIAVEMTRRRRGRRRIIHFIRSHANEGECKDRKKFTPQQMWIGDGIAESNIGDEGRPESGRRPNEIIQYQGNACDISCGCCENGSLIGSGKA